VVRKGAGTSGTVHYYHRNQQYSIYAITDAAANIAERYAYTAYGQPTILDAAATVVATSAISNRYTYTAREWDATVGLYHFRARWMSGLTGRFLTRDPIGYEGSDWNLYEYVDSQPTIKIDPYGLDGWIPFPRVPGGEPGCINPTTGLPCGETPEPATPEVICTALGAVVVCLAITPIPGDEVVGVVVCKKICESAATRAARRAAAERAAAGLRRQLEAHREKLWDYIRDPLAHDNKGILQEMIRKGAPPERIRAVIEGRIRNLQGQIDNFQRQIDEIMRCL